MKSKHTSAWRHSLQTASGRLGAVDGLFVALPCLVFLTLAAVCHFTDADLALSRRFYSGEESRWPWAQVEPWGILYRRGCSPALWIGIGGLVVALLSRFAPVLRRYRAFGFYLAVTLALGPGLVVNGVLKPCVGRPRPMETIPFGGEKQFTYVGASASAGEAVSKSFPSGHASMGFFLMTPALFYYRRRPLFAFVMLSAGLVYGTLIGMARIAQGAHFTTDVIASALFVYGSGILVMAVMRWSTLYAEAKCEQAQRIEGEPESHILHFPDQPPVLAGARKETPRAA